MPPTKRAVNDQAQERDGVKIVLTGGSGDLATVLTPKLEARGHMPIRILCHHATTEACMWRAPCSIAPVLRLNSGQRALGQFQPSQGWVGSRVDTSRNYWFLLKTLTAASSGTPDP